MKWIIAAFSLILLPFTPYTADFSPATEAVSYSQSSYSKAFERLLELFDIPPSSSPQEIVEATQRLWLQKGKERWEFEPRYESLRPKLWPLFQQMGLLEKIEPRETHYDYALVHGALLNRVQERVDYLNDLWKQGVRFDQIVFLSGARPLQESEKQIVRNLATEREMVEWVYNHSDLPKEIPVLFIDAPMKQQDGIWVRPQTSCTIIHWLMTKPESGSCLAISNQPYAAYQDAVFRNYLPPGFNLETVGPAAGSPSVAILLDTIAKELYTRTQNPRDLSH